MKLNQKLFKCIVDLLHPHMDEDNRRTLITPIFFDYDSLYSQIKWSGDNKAFATRLVEQLATYGRVESGEESLVLLLKTLGSEVGLDKKQKIEELLQRLAPMQSTGEYQQDYTVKVDFSRKKQRNRWGCTISIMMASTITVMLMLLISRNYTIQMKTLNPLSWQIATHTPTPTTISTELIPITSPVKSTPSIVPSLTQSPLSTSITSMPTKEIIPEVIPSISISTPVASQQGVPTPLSTWTPVPGLTRSPLPTSVTPVPIEEIIPEVIPSISISTPVASQQGVPTPLATWTPIPTSTPTLTTTLTPTRVVPITPVAITPTVAAADSAILDNSIPTVSTAITLSANVISTTNQTPIDFTNIIDP